MFCGGHSVPKISLTIIVPIGPKDQSWRSFVKTVKRSCPEAHVIFVSTQEPLKRDLTYATKALPRLRWLVAPKGRGSQLNFGAKQAKTTHLWFLHCDTQFTKEAAGNLTRDPYQQLIAKIGQYPNELWYFDLAFAEGAPPMMYVNQLGVYLRSHVLRMPFGDQGLACAKALWLEVGGFAEDAPYGEDHLFVWRTHRLGIRLRCVGETLWTSARKYQHHGWLLTTGRHLYLTFRQAGPEFFYLMKQRLTVKL